MAKFGVVLCRNKFSYTTVSINGILVKISALTMNNHHYCGMELIKLSDTLDNGAVV
jgi:hypothetical protein